MGLSSGLRPSCCFYRSWRIFRISAAHTQTSAIPQHLSPEGTQYIGITSSSNGYTMKVVSGRLCKDNAVVLVTFEKDDGTAFQGNWSPDFSLFLDDGSQMPFSGFSDGLYSELSQDQKTLSCYYTWRFPSSEAGRSVTLKADKLICSDSQAGYAPIPEPIAGELDSQLFADGNPGQHNNFRKPRSIQHDNPPFTKRCKLTASRCRIRLP